MPLNKAKPVSDSEHLLCLLAHRVERLLSYHPHTPRPQEYRDRVRSIERDLLKLAREIG